MIWLLDTNVLIHSLNGIEPVRSRLNALPMTDRAVTSVLVLAELMYGVERSARRDANLLLLDRELSAMEIVPVTPAAARRFGRLKAGLRVRGLTKGDIDLLLAATALELGATLVSNDQALLDGTIPELRVENWTGAPSSGPPRGGRAI